MDSEIVEADTDGSICSIHVRNFFCHANLQIDLNKNVNFIVGRNGSGKSAILTALVVGLGGRASATNRGNNLHSFIKKGANSASVEIKIRNSSEQAYKHDVYGDFIAIERHMNASGGSSYKVKNAAGSKVYHVSSPFLPDLLQWYPREGSRKRSRPQRRLHDDIKKVAVVNWQRSSQDDHTENHWKTL